MATGRKINAQIAVIPNTKCQLCEENEINWKCFTCDEYLCNHCKKTHLKGRATRDHKITTVSGADKQQDDRQDSGDATCSKHPTEDVIMFCQDCSYPICADCISSGSHKHHTIKKLQDIIDEKKKELSTIIDKTNGKLSKFEQKIKSIRKIGADYSKDVSRSIEEVKSRNDKLKVMLDKITNEVIEKLQHLDKQNQEVIKQNENRIADNISEIKEILKECKEKQKKRETVLVQFVTDAKKKLEEFKPYYPSDPPSPPTFVSKDVDDQTLRDLFGDLDKQDDKNFDHERRPILISTSIMNPTIDIKVISTFNARSTDLVRTVSDTQAWIGDYIGKDVKLITSKGDVIQTVKTDFKVYDMAVTKSGELLVTMYGGNKVKKLTTNGRFIDLYVAPAAHLTRYQTQGITVTDNNDIVVGLYNGEKEGKLVQLSHKGQLLKSFQYDTDSQTPLFDDPQRVGSNINGDLIVIDQGKKVVVVDKTGHKRFTYTGQIEGLKNPFSPHYSVTDKYGHVIISDYLNSVIHLLDKNGKFLQFILTTEDGLQRPTRLSIDTSGRLWVCDIGNNRIWIVKYV